MSRDSGLSTELLDCFTFRGNGLSLVSAEFIFCFFKRFLSSGIDPNTQWNIVEGNVLALPLRPCLCQCV